EHVRADAIMVGTLRTIVRRRHPVFLKTLRSELFLNDLALKRETMICGSLQALSQSSRRVDRASEAWAKQLLCRMHRLADWDVVEGRIREWGISQKKLRRFIRSLASARACRDVPRSPVVPDAWPIADARFGLRPSPKPAGEGRFSLPIEEALALARTIQ